MERLDYYTNNRLKVPMPDPQQIFRIKTMREKAKDKPII